MSEDSEYVSKLAHKIKARSRKRKLNEMAFLLITVGLLAFGIGYVLGTLRPYQPGTMEWADKLGKVRGRK